MVSNLIKHIQKSLNNILLDIHNPRLIQLNRSYGKYFSLSFLVFNMKQKNPVAIVKAAKTPEKIAALNQEYMNLKILQDSAPNPAFAKSIPEPYHLAQMDEYTILIESVLPGKRMKNFYPAIYLRSKSFKTHLNSLVTWLPEFHDCCGVDKIDMTQHKNHDKLLEYNIDNYRNIFKYSDKLNSLLDDTVNKLDGITTNLVAWHGDFCTANVVVRDNGHIGVIDWENSLDEKCWVLADILYFVSSLQCTAYRRGLAGLEHNYRTLFFSRTFLTKLLQDSIHNYAKKMDISTDLILYYSVICWVMYANMKHDYLAQNGISMDSDDAVIHYPLIMISDGRCLNLELLAEPKNDYIFHF